MNELKPCPFCGRKMAFYRETYINKYGHKVTKQYYMHEGEDSDCILDKICMPFVIGAGDADTENGNIGEYAEQWNRRADVQEVRHGKWSIAYAVPDHNVKIQYGYQCSECEAVLNRKTNFCGNCGAKMDGKDGGENA